MFSYYSTRLSAERLKRVYDIAPPRVQQYLDAEIQHVITHIRQGDCVLELGCGYGRVIARLATQSEAESVIGIDISLESLRYGIQLCRPPFNYRLLQMDAAQLGFRDESMDIVLCIQNGLSAFKIDPKQLLSEALRVTKPGGKVLLSSYSEKFWPERLKWFELQSHEGLLGPIDYDKTGDGVIVCTDGFTARTISPAEFQSLVDELRVRATIIEVDGSSLFCEIIR